eukprot:CAMPEP_0179133644 /NCGR_PEP_ID=MMETSP0796-20121207/63560_1 /TAXON_ID=73915 /ORGANISM="Pyrodinium bahamense, Strain pbaha01" /LENGTH=51 /DNA_ID=CAMNT_0020832609 /DNA_START=51 /DNA_END=202 /DNA_ORIENTATION=-
MSGLLSPFLFCDEERTRAVASSTALWYAAGSARVPGEDTGEPTIFESVGSV